MSAKASKTTISNRDRALAILRFQNYDRLPIVHFGFWDETPLKWAEQGHISRDQAQAFKNGNQVCAEICTELGFDFGWGDNLGPANWLRPSFERKVIKECDDGSLHVLNRDGVIVFEKPGINCIPAEIGHTLTDRQSWERDYKHRFQWSEERITESSIRANGQLLKWNQGGLEYLKTEPTAEPRGCSCGSLYGNIRNIMGVEGTCYMQADDPELFDEIVDTVADLCFRCLQGVLEAGARFDYGHFWEDICFKNGPLVSPAYFAEKVGPHYKRITDLLTKHGIDIVSLDCDGLIDALVPTWIENGVNTMFPIEVGTWKASLAPWRELYGRKIMGIGGMDKKVFAYDKIAVKKEVERLKPLVDLGGFIPCPDHRIPPDAKWELVKYYTELMVKTFG